MSAPNGDENHSGIVEQTPLLNNQSAAEGEGNSNQGTGEKDLEFGNMSESERERYQWYRLVVQAFDAKADCLDNTEQQLCVFQVPESVSSNKPEAYMPRLVGMGPYCHFDKKLKAMEKVKLDAAKRVLQSFDQTNMQTNDQTNNQTNICNLITQLQKHDPTLRACYHKFLELDRNVLLLMLVTDALFLFELLCCHLVDNSTFKEVFLANLDGGKLGQDAMLRDVMMLHNQIPMFFIKEILSIIALPSPTVVETKLPTMLVTFCESLSPMKVNARYPLDKVLTRLHMLDLLYSMVIQNEAEAVIDVKQDNNQTNQEKGHPEKELRTVGRTVARGVLSTDKVANLVKESAKLPALSNNKSHIEFVSTLIQLPYDELLKAIQAIAPPPEPDVLIPTASSLAKARIRFETCDYIKQINFEENMRTFKLPVMKLGVNSEVVIRNLVAYEAMAKSGSMILARYIDMMNWLIEKPEDAQLLREKGIIMSKKLTDEEICNLFNGMSKSIETTKLFLDDEIEKVKNFYSRSWKIKFLNTWDKCIYSFWKVLTVIAILIILLLMILQSFCSAYTCSTWRR